MPRIVRNADYIFSWNISNTRSARTQEMALKSLQAGVYDARVYRYLRLQLNSIMDGKPIGYKVIRYKPGTGEPSTELLTAYFRRSPDKW